MEEALDVVWCCNDNPLYISMLNESFHSVYAYNKRIRAHVITTSPSPIDGIDKRIHQVFCDHDIEFRERLNTYEGPKDRLKNVSYLKLFIPELLTNVDKCLFVDCDCLCFRDIAPLFDLPVKYLYMSPIDVMSIRKKQLGIGVNDHYFSSGIMLMNLRELRNIGFRNKMLTHMFSIKVDFWCHEETLINYNFHDQVQVFDNDVQRFRSSEFRYNDFEALKKNSKNIFFLHVGGSNKRIFFDLLKYSDECSGFANMDWLKEKVSVYDFVDKRKYKRILVDPHHSQMRKWFEQDYEIVSDPECAQVAIFHGTNYSAESNKPYVQTILKHRLPVISIEDAFLRSIYPSRASVDKKFKSSVGFSLNNFLYFEGTKETTLDKMIESQGELTYEQLENVRKIVSFIRDNEISKYNCQKHFDLGMKNDVVLVIDQAFADQSILCSNADQTTFEQMLETAIVENPNANICVKVHPESMTGGRGGFFTEAVISKIENKHQRKIYRLEQPMNPVGLIKQAKKVYVVSSGFGFESLMLGVDTSTFGCPFYSGLGLTHDHNPMVRAKKQISIEQLVHVVFERFSIFKNPVTYKKMTTLEALDYLLNLRREAGI